MVKLLRLDPARIVLIGHSVGGFMAIQAAAADPDIMAIGLISAADLGGRIPQPFPKEWEASAIKAMSAGFAHEGMAPLEDCTPEGLARETLANAAQWRFLAKVGPLRSRPALVITSDDGFAPSNNDFAASLRTAGDNRVMTLHLPTDHSYSDQRSALSTVVLQWLTILRSYPQYP